MFRRNSFWLVIISVFVIMLMAACGSGGSGAPAGSGTPAGSEGSAGADLPQVTWKLASQSADNVLFASMLRDVAAEVSERTNGGFNLQVYTNASLGSDREIAEGVQAGIIDCGQVTQAVLANFCPALGVSDLPYLIPDWESAKIFLTDPQIYEIQKNALADNGFHFFGAVCYGFRQCTNNIRPINTLEDFVGIKFRVMQSDIYIATFKALGAYPVGMAKAEVVTALQQHTIDGQENPMEINFNEGMADVQKYLSKTSHVSAFADFVCNPASYAALPDEYKTVLDEVFAEYLLKTTEGYQREEDEYAQKLADAGMEYNIVSEENLAEFRRVCQEQVWPQFADQFADQIAIIETIF
ncbi:MAG: TRAP transporter substrate-binding protein [Gracilibacteraceae bacterium]|jgi:tripartite ATP-independent transporter DctP family solute receptor|nr:TRAP transporter substrate-binding protein [Gracilibacteraceae bacterium]